jgi:hypothetical protein
LPNLPNCLNKRRLKVAYLRGLLQSIKGLRVGKEDPGGAGNPNDLPTGRYKLEEFGGLGRDLFRPALAAEAIPAVQIYMLQPSCASRHL